MADVTILTAVSGATEDRGRLCPIVWVSTLTGYYLVYSDTNSRWQAMKTTDGAASWAEVDVAGAPEAVPRSHGYAPEAENGTPDDVDAMHVVWLDVTDDELQHAAFDIGTETWGGMTVANSAAITTVGTDTQSAMAVAVSDEGKILAPFRPEQGTGEHGVAYWNGSAWSDVDGGGPSALPWWGDAQIDQVQVCPINGGVDFLTVMWDEGSDALRIGGFDTSTTSWVAQADQVTIASKPLLTANGTNGSRFFALAYDYVNDRAVLIVIDDLGDGGDTRDVQLYTITWDGIVANSPVSTSQGEAVTNDDELDAVEIILDMHQELLHAIYTRGVAGSQQVYRKQSALAGSFSWGSESSALMTDADDYRVIGRSVIRPAIGGRIAAHVYDDDDVRILVNADNSPAVTVGTPVIDRGGIFGGTAGGVRVI